MIPTASSLTIYTVGHSNQSPEEFCQLLKAKGISVVVDVRSKPYSRYARQFNRQALEKFLPECGFQYIFKGDVLGGLPEKPSLLGPDRKVSYPALLKDPDFQKGIEEVLALARQLAVAGPDLGRAGGPAPGADTGFEAWPESHQGSQSAPGLGPQHSTSSNSRPVSGSCPGRDSSSAAKPGAASAAKPASATCATLGSATCAKPSSVAVAKPSSAVCAKPGPQAHFLVLMCAEEDPARCHRHHVLAVALRERGAKVLHLRRSGEVQRDEEVGN